MGDQQDDYLWDPTARPDPDVVALERVLYPHSASMRGYKLRPPRAIVPKRFVKVVSIAVLLAAAACAAVFVAIDHRLSWPAGASWEVTVGARPDVSRLMVGRALVTAEGETATIRAARIGEVELAPDSRLRLIETRRGRHRVELERGRMHAKVWAPSAHFGVAVRDARIVDLGCEFELTAEPDGSGMLSVLSGWVMYGRGIEMLVPAGYALTFSSTEVSTPLRVDASEELRRAAEVLDALLARAANDVELQLAAEALASAARDIDYYTLLSLLTRHSRLASGSIYVRLQASLAGGPIDEGHRARWLRGDSAAINAWWDKLPQQPKTWWLNWRDAF